MPEIDVDWSIIKTASDDRNIPLQYVETPSLYFIFLTDGNLTFRYEMYKSDPAHTDQTDFESNYKPDANSKISGELNYDNRQIVHSTPRYRGSTTCFSSQDDDQTDPSRIWGGSNKIELDHLATDPLSQSIYFDLNTIANKTYVLTGSLCWEDAYFDEWSCSIVPKVTPYSAGTNTNYDLYGGYLIIPAAGTGSIDVNPANFALVQNPLNEFGNRMGGYWDATYNTTLKQFENIVPNVYGQGEFNLFGVEITLSKFVNNMKLLGSKGNQLSSFDAEQIGHNMRLKFDFETKAPNHAWKFGGCITLFRDKTT